MSSTSAIQNQSSTPASLVSITPSAPIIPYYACYKCRGKGLRARTQRRGMPKPSSSAKRQREAGTNESADDVGHVGINGDTLSSGTTSTPAPSSSTATPNVSYSALGNRIVWDPCQHCKGSGLLPISSFSSRRNSDSNAPTAAASSTAPAFPLPPVPSPTAPFVVISGCGIGGGALALACQQRGIPFRVFERDTTFEARSQGYGLTLQQGGAAMAALGIELDPLGVSSTAHLSFDPSGTVLGSYGRALDGRNVRASHETRHNLHLPRQRLREAIIRRIQPEFIEWGVCVESFEDSSNGVQVRLSNGQTIQAGVLVAADGIRSTIRARKLNDSMNYLGLIVILGYTRTPHRALKLRVMQTADGDTRIYSMPFSGNHVREVGQNEGELVKDGKIALAGLDPSVSSSSASSIPSITLTTKEMDEDTTMWQLSFPVTEAEALTLHQGGSSALKAEALRRCGTWHAPIPELIVSTPDETITGYPAYDREIPAADVFRYGVEEKSKDLMSKITLIGDAAHPMSPFKGQGANQALLDAVALARALTDVDWTLKDGEEPAAAKSEEQPSKRQHVEKDTAVATSSGSHQDSTPSSSPSPSPSASPSPSSSSGAYRRVPLSTALRNFEQAMWARAAPKVMESRVNAAYLHSPAVMSQANCTRAAAAKAAATSYTSSN